MKNILLILLLFGFSGKATAAMNCIPEGTYCSNVVITNYLVRDDGRILLMVDGVIPKSCSHFGRQLRYQTNNGTDADNPMISSLLTLLSQKKKLQMSITPAAVSVQETDQKGGCTIDSPSRINNIRASFDPAEFGTDGAIPVGDELMP